MSDLIQLLYKLATDGQYGIITIVLIVVILGTLWIIWLQRQTIARFELLTKTVELNMKAADTAREQSMAVQKETREGLEKQFDVVIRTNEELRKELERYKSDQARFENDVKKALAVGFDELKSSLSKVTIAEIVDQIPESFKQDIEKETRQAAERAVQGLGDRIAESATTWLQVKLREGKSSPQLPRPK